MSNGTKTTTSLKLIQITPLPTNNLLKDTTTEITGIPYDTNNPKYNRNGTYIATSSSYANPANKAFNIFNGSASAPWSCDFSNNSNYNSSTFSNPRYLRDPYTANMPSSYQGGGQTSTYYGTLLGTGNKAKTIYGEWVQLQLPYQVYLYRYNIVIPTSKKGSSYFPKKFMVVGSNDGNKWDYIHQKDFTNDSLNNNGTMIEYNINSPDKYSYFRLIISELFDHQNKISIKQWNMFGTVDPTINNEAFTDMSSSDKNYQFVDLNKSGGNYIEYNDPSYFMKKLEPFDLREGLDNSLINSIRSNEAQLQNNSAINGIFQDAINNQYSDIQKNSNLVMANTEQYLKDANDNGVDTLHPKPKLIDGKKEDSKSLMNQETNILTIGTICSVLLIVFAIAAARGNQ